MNTYPLHSLSLEEAMKLQFKVVDCITKEFEGHEILTRGDLGVVMGLNKPVTTAKAEKVIARIFDAEACVLVIFTPGMWAVLPGIPLEEADAISGALLAGGRSLS